MAGASTVGGAVGAMTMGAGAGPRADPKAGPGGDPSGVGACAEVSSPGTGAYTGRRPPSLKALPPAALAAGGGPAPARVGGPGGPTGRPGRPDGGLEGGPGGGAGDPKRLEAGANGPGPPNTPAGTGGGAKCELTGGGVPKAVGVVRGGGPVGVANGVSEGDSKVGTGGSGPAGDWKGLAAGEGWPEGWPGPESLGRDSVRYKSEGCTWKGRPPPHWFTKVAGGGVFDAARPCEATGAGWLSGELRGRFRL